MRRAHNIAGLEYSQTTFVECYNTKTPAGDSMKGQALTRVFNEKGVFIESVKPNMGHSESAADGTSVIKAILTLERQIIPPNINFTTPNPKISFKEGHLQVPTEATPWFTGRLQRVYINSFDLDGANAHAIFDSATQFGVRPSLPKDSPCYKLLLFSANHDDSLSRLVDSYRLYLEKKPSAIGSLTYTLACRRKHLLHRSFSVSKDSKTFDVSTPQKTAVAPSSVFVFTGQGA